MHSRRGPAEATLERKDIREAQKESEGPTKGREVNTKVLASGLGTVALVLLVDPVKSQSLWGNRPSPGVHSAVMLWVFSPMWLLKRFSAMAASLGRDPASMGVGASSQGTLFTPPLCHQPQHTPERIPGHPSILRFNPVSKEEQKPASLLSALIALSTFEALFKV